MSLPSTLEFLRTLEPFHSWEQKPTLAAALRDLAGRCSRWSFLAGDVVRFPDEQGQAPCWVLEGCLVMQRGDESPIYVGVRESLSREPGFTVKGQTPGRFVSVEPSAWNQWLARWPQAAQEIGEVVPEPVPRSFLHSPLILEPGELLRHRFRKSGWFLVRRLLLPSVFLACFLGFGALLQSGLGDRVPLLALWFLPGLGSAVCLSLMTLVTWEWRTSVLAITDRAVLVRQVDLWAHRSDFEKLALDRLREAVFVRTGWIDTILGLVSLEIEGDSPRGRLKFPGLPNTSTFLDAMESLRQAQSRTSSDRSRIRQALARHQESTHAPVLEEAPQKGAGDSGKGLQGRRWRYEREGSIWFRRHPWVVWQKSLGPLGWIGLIAFVAFVAAGLWPQGTMAVVICTLVAAAVPLARIVWEFWDWRDDQLSIQGDQVIMVHRRPLWLTEVRQQGLLSDMEQVGVLKPTLTAMLFDFGTVTITLGGAEPLVFEHASHPEWVQNELFFRRSLMAQLRHDRERDAQLNQMSEVIDAWQEAKREGYFDKGTAT